MANIKSEKKRILVRKRNHDINAAFKSSRRTAIKKVDQAIAAKDGALAVKLLPEAVSLIDKSVKKGIQHKNTAARQKSRLTLAVNSLSAAKAPEAK